MNIKTTPSHIAKKVIIASIFSSLILSGCTDETSTEEETTSRTNEETIQTVIEKEFNGPNEQYKKLLNASFEKQSTSDSKEDYDAYLLSKEYQELDSYVSSMYEPYFTKNGYENFINTSPALFYSTFEDDYTLKTENIEIQQNEIEPTLYTFEFDVLLSKEELENQAYEFDGEAILPEDGKIGKIQFVDKNFLIDELQKK